MGLLLAAQVHRILGDGGVVVVLGGGGVVVVCR